MAGMADHFAGMDTAPMFGSGQYFGEGNFLVRTKSLKLNNGHKGLCFIAEFDVIESNSDKDPVGSTRSWVVKMGQNKNAFSDIKGFVFALTGKDPKKVGAPELNPKLHAEAASLVKAAVDEEYAKSIGASPGDLEGIEVRLQTFQKPTRPSPGKPEGGVFTVHAWSPVEEVAA